jgi:alkylation response protein AidB-like acyl-CoA dehydrogenase
MPIDPTPEQRGLCSTFNDFLERNAPPSKLRELIMDGPTLDRDYWRQLAELGWTSLLVSEERGGGSLTDNPYADIALVAEVSGRHIAPGPFVPANVVAAALSSAPGEDHQEMLDGILAGSIVPTWAIAEGRGTFAVRDIEATATRSEDGYVLAGTKKFVESATDADVILVCARDEGDVAHFLVRAGSAGMTVQPQHGLDPGRGYGTVVLDDVSVASSARVASEGSGDEEVQRLLDLAVALQSAESVGGMQRVFDITMEWVQNRYAFGRPIGSYQALKHRLADHKLWFEASAGLVDGLTDALAAGHADASRIASLTKSHVGDTAVRLASDATQLHGGIGVTWEHDMHLFLRRATVNRAMYGSPIQHRDRLCELAGL